MGPKFNRKRFLPYIQMHEFEALLFSRPEVIAEVLSDAKVVDDLKAIRDEFNTPEEIDDDPLTAPPNESNNSARPTRSHFTVPSRRSGLASKSSDRNAPISTIGCRPWSRSANRAQANGKQPARSAMFSCVVNTSRIDCVFRRTSASRPAGLPCSPRRAGSGSISSHALWPGDDHWKCEFPQPDLALLRPGRGRWDRCPPVGFPTACSNSSHEVCGDGS